MTISGEHFYSLEIGLTRYICKDSKHTVYSRKSRARPSIQNSLPSMHIEEYFLSRTNSWVYHLSRDFETTSEVLADIKFARAVLRVEVYCCNWRVQGIWQEDCQMVY